MDTTPQQAEATTQDVIEKYQKFVPSPAALPSQRLIQEVDEGG